MLNVSHEKIKETPDNVIPVEARFRVATTGIQKVLKSLDSRLRDCVVIGKKVKSVMLNLFQHRIKSRPYETLNQVGTTRNRVQGDKIVITAQPLRGSDDLGVIRGSLKKTGMISALDWFVLLGVVVFLIIGTYKRNLLWNDEIGLWTDCVKKSPGKARPYSNLGFAHFEAGQYDKSLEFTEKAIRLDPTFAQAYHNLGLTHQKMGDLKKAAGMVRKAIDLDPNLSIAHYSLGSILFEDGQHEEASHAFRRFLKIFPYFPNVHHLLGVAYAAQKKFDKAVEEFEWELKINPYHALAHLNAGQIYWYEFQNKGKALYHLKVALALDPFLPNRREIQNLVRQLERIL
jgi:tetratricopeptide (TPR) repeat protein